MTRSLEAKVERLEQKAFHEKCEAFLYAKFPAIASHELTEEKVLEMAWSLGEHMDVPVSPDHDAQWSKLDAEINKYIRGLYPRD
jgi:hypothetical protein